MIEKLIGKLLKYITPEEDKLKHHWQWDVAFYSCLALAALVNYLFNNHISDWYSYFFIVAIAAYKELIHDWLFDKGTPEFKDFFSGVFGPTAFMLFKHFLL